MNEYIKVMCALDKDFNSEKFLKLRLKVCHDGINKNNSIFTLDAIKKASDTISLVPILANVVKDENGEYQFSGHDMTIETNAFDDSQTKIIYQEVPIGFVPIDCNYAIEQSDEGMNYVNIDGYVWKEYSNYAQEIIERDETVNLSMEIAVKDYEEQVCEDGVTRINITDFSYTGITLLGNDVEPAMYDACAKLITFSLEKGVDATVVEMAEQLDSILKKPNTEPHTFSMSCEEFENLKKLCETQKYEIKSLTQQVEELTEFKTQVLSKQRLEELNQVIAKWETSLSDCEEFNALKTNVDTYSVEDLEVKCKCIFADVQLKALAQKSNKPKSSDANNMVNFSFSNPHNNEVFEVNSEKDTLIKKYLN
jgi:hypothetical protein